MALIKKQLRTINIEKFLQRDGIGEDVVNFICDQAFAVEKYYFLTEKQKQVLIQRIIEKRSYTEIGKFFKNSSTSIRSVFLKGIRNIRKHMLTAHFKADSLIEDTPFVSRFCALYNYCQEKGIKKLSDLDGHSYVELLRQRNFGKTSIDFLQKIMESVGLSLDLKIPVKEKTKGNIKKLIRLASELAYSSLSMNEEEKKILKEHIHNLFYFNSDIPSSNSLTS